MVDVISFILIGALGGFVRALYGFMKAVNRDQKIKINYFLITIITAGIIGGILGSVFTTDYRITALAGYAGTDILENIFKGAIGDTIVLQK